jgi:pimeloyl-ACP methyl ester carboxylesterase
VNVPSRLFAIITAVFLGGTIVHATPTAKVDHWIAPSNPGELSLHVSERAAERRCGQPQVLLLHAYGVPSAAAFDIPNASLTEHLASRGRTSWALDLSGFGMSERPPSMERPATETRPLFRASEVIGDVDRVVAFIGAACPGDRIDVLGWSWGGVVAGMWAAKQPPELRRLILLDSMYGFKLPSMARLFADPNNPDAVNPKLPAYGISPASAIIQQWEGMLRESGLPFDTLRDAVSATQVVEAFLSSDPNPHTQGSVRRPNGPLVDLFEIWSGRPVYDAARIVAPTLVIHGDADEFSDSTLVPRLTNSCGRREVIVGDGTHYMLYERVRIDIYGALDAFLAGPDPLCGDRKRS